MLIAALISMWQELRWIEMVNCPACWLRPRQHCVPLDGYGTRPGATPRYDLPLMYHHERMLRARRKVGFPG